MDQIIIRIERYRQWDCDGREIEPDRPYQARMYRGPTTENRMIASAPYRATAAAARADVFSLRQGQFE